MSAPAPGGEQPEIRVSDADRERVVELLRTHTADGRITLDEFSERVGQAYAARTQRDLEVLTADLPVPRSTAPPVPAPPPRPPAPPGGTTWVIGVMSGQTRRGAWAPGERVTALAVMGACTLDLRDAQLDGGEVRISAVAIMGGIEVLVAPGMRVEFSGVPLMGSTECKAPTVPPEEATAVVHVTAFALMGGIDVKAKPVPARRERDRDRNRDRHPRRPIAAGPGASDGATATHPNGAAAANGSRPAGLPTTGTVTILFTDIEGFTDLTERVGDEAAHEIVKRHAALVREQVAACGGLEVNTAGDGFMIAFSSARQAVRCAVAIQRGLAGWTATDGKPVRVRIGLHTGDAINDADDFFGLTVNVAARIAASAGGGEILVSHITRTLAGNMGDVEFGEERALQLRGVSGEHRAHLVDWAGADATQ